MQDRHREAILRHRERLAEETTDTEFESILRQFVERRVLNDRMVSKIRGARSSLEIKKAFYEMVTKRGPEAFFILLEVLTTLNLNHLYSILQENRGIWLRWSSHHRISAWKFLISRLNRNIGSVLNTIWSLLGKTMTFIRLLFEGNIQNNNNDMNGAETDGGCFGRPKNLNNGTCEKGDEVYSVKSQPKGYALIVNIMNFLGFPDQKRNGSDSDVKRLKKLLESRGFHVIVKKDLKKLEFENYLRSFTQEEKLKKVDSFFLFVMTHGRNEQDDKRKLFLSMHDRQEVDSQWIIEQCNSVNCKYLSGKPKIIVFQACRGGYGDRGVAIQLDSFHHTEPSLKPKVRLVPSLADMLVVYSTLPGCVAERDPEKGSFFIQDFCEIAETGGEQKINELLNKVSRKLRERFNYGEMKFAQGLHSETFLFDKTFIF